MNVTLWDSSSDVRKELSIQDDRTESDNRIEVTLLIGITEINLPHKMCIRDRLLVLNIDFSASSSQPSQVNNGIQEVEKAFAQLSSADQDYLLSVYQEDVFLNN